MKSTNGFWKAAKLAGIQGVFLGYGSPLFYLALYFGLSFVVQSISSPNKFVGPVEFLLAFLNAFQAGWLAGSVPAVIGAILGGLFGLIDAFILGVLHKRLSLSDPRYRLRLRIANGILGLVSSLAVLYVLGSYKAYSVASISSGTQIELGLLWGVVVPSAIVGLYAFVFASNILRIYDAAKEWEDALHSPLKRMPQVGSEGARSEDSGAIEHYNRGLAQLKNGKIYDTIAEFETYLQINPNAPDRAQVERWIQMLKGS